MSTSKQNGKPLKLTAFDNDGIEIISSLMQDAIITGGSFHFDKAASRFVVMANRYRWEARKRWSLKRWSFGPGSRVKSALTVKTVHHIRMKNMALKNIEETYNLLTVKPCSETKIQLIFAAGAVIELDVEAIDLTMTDTSDHWSAIKTPRHDI